MAHNCLGEITMRLVLLAISTALLCGSFAVQAKMYKWVDEKDQVHFGDRIPVKYQLKAHEEINQSGIVMKSNAAAKTAEEKRQEKILAKEQRAVLAKEKRKRQRDRVLLDTYTTERDLLVARDSRLDAVGSQIKLANSIMSDSNKQIASLEKRVTVIEESNREVPADLHKQIKNQQQQIAVHEEVKAGHVKRRDLVAKQFNGFIARFKILKAEQKRRREKLAAERMDDY